MLCSDTSGRYNHKQNDALGYFMWVGVAKIGVRSSSCYFLDVCLSVGLGPFPGPFPSPYIQNWGPGQAPVLRLELSWHGTKSCPSMESI